MIGSGCSRTWPSQTNSYARWRAEANPGDILSMWLSPVTGIEQLRADPAFAIVTPDECVEIARRLGPTVSWPSTRSPPELAWGGLRTFADGVLSVLRELGPVARGPARRGRSQFGGPSRLGRATAPRDGNRRRDASNDERARRGTGARPAVNRGFQTDRTSLLIQNYAMSEVMTGNKLCTEDRFQIEPWAILFVLDPDTGAALPREGIQTGRAAFYDLLAESCWGGFVSGDEVTVDWTDPFPCGKTTVHIARQVERYGLKRGGDDKSAVRHPPPCAT